MLVELLGQKSCWENVHSGSHRVYSLQSSNDSSLRVLFYQGVKLEVGEVLDTLVLDYDLVNKRVDLSVDSNIVRKRKEIKSKNKKKVANTYKL